MFKLHLTYQKYYLLYSDALAAVTLTSLAYWNIKKLHIFIISVKLTPCLLNSSTTWCLQLWQRAGCSLGASSQQPMPLLMLVTLFGQSAQLVWMTWLHDCVCFCTKTFTITLSLCTFLHEYISFYRHYSDIIWWRYCSGGLELKVLIEQSLFLFLRPLILQGIPWLRFSLSMAVGEGQGLLVKREVVLWWGVMCLLE